MLPRCARLPVCLSKALVRQRTAGKAHHVAWTHELGEDSVRPDTKLDVCNPRDSPRNTRRTCFVFPKLDSNRTWIHEHIKFDFLGYTFRSRTTTNRDGQLFSAFTPAVSRSALTTMRRSTRCRRLHLHSECYSRPVKRCPMQTVFGTL